MKKIFLYENERSLLLFLLLNNFFEDEYFFIVEENKKNNFFKLSKNIFRNVILFNNKNSLYDRTIGVLLFRKKNKKLFNEIKDNIYEIYGLDHVFLGNEVFYKEELYLIEDGLINYSFYNSFLTKSLKVKMKKMLLFFVKKIFNLKIKVPYGVDDLVKKIYLTGLATVPKKIANKVEIINLKNLWEKKTEEEKNAILKIFDFDKNILKKIGFNAIILFTQPLSEDKILTEEEKIEVYSNILENYNNKSIIIKPHPREKTDYSKYFPSYYVMKEKYPVEILGLVGINIKKAVTIFSTAAFGLGKNIEIDFYGTEIHPKLFKRFGSQDAIMKRNAFLDEEEKK